MKIYGEGQLRAPGTSRVIWDFEDGPFDTVNPVLIAEARRRGLSFEPPVAAPVIERRKPVRPPKIVSEAEGAKPEKKKATK
ncbi:MAG: hypothetical protein WC481_07645 [Candidatus Omnitrophota bacterium]